MPTPVVFTPELLTSYSKQAKLTDSLLHKIATLEGIGWENRRTQIERAAASIPETKRSRVLGALLGKSSTNDQVRTTIGSLLLAKTLEDLGWAVEHEPEVAGGTPDLRIQKNRHQYLIEIRRIIDSRSTLDDRAISKIRDALGHIQTNTPLSFKAFEVSGGASLKRFVKHVETVLADPCHASAQEFREKDVYISYEVRPPLEGGLKVPAASYWPVQTLIGPPANNIREAINEKLIRYKTPLIVALDLVDPYASFEDVEDVLFGMKVVSMDFDPEQGLVGQPRFGRSSSGLLIKRNSDGFRAHQRLLATLPFSLKTPDQNSSYHVHACLLAGPAQDPLHKFKEFAPIPRLVVVSETSDDLLMWYHDKDDELLTQQEVARWNYQP